ncbi:DNA primase [Candidatus Saccharibacteria bacterium]|nr:DNA primase [Candidatus Saccharibacteria bacterium]
MQGDAVQEIKSRLNIEDVLSEYVQLKRAGRNFKGLSPWTNEKTPSFIVSPEKQIWHDFSSGKGGDIFSFVMEMEGLDFPGVLELLARKAGVDLDQFRQVDPAAGRLKKRLLEALELAAKFYQKQLMTSRPALGYLRKQRGFSKQTLLDFRLGFAPSTGQALAKFLVKRGFTKDELKRAGLAIERRGELVDMFRGRIMIPLADSAGQIVGFTARQLIDDPSGPKYINTPATTVYDKGRQVFGLHHAKEAIRSAGAVVVVEGNMDVIASHQVAVKNVVASAGTAMTENHLKVLKRFTGDIRLSFDGDRAGLEATERIIPLAQKTGVDLSIINTGAAKDPDELIQKDPKLWRQAIERKTYIVDWLIERYQKQLDLKSASGKRQFTDAVLPTIGRLLDPVEQEHYLKLLAKLADTTFEAVKAKLGKAAEAPQAPRRQPKSSAAELDRQALEYQKLQDHFLAIIFMQPGQRSLANDLKPDLFNKGPAQTIFEFLQKQPNFKGSEQAVAALRPVSDYVKILGLQFEELYADLPADDLRELVNNLKRRLIARYVKNRKLELVAAMAATNNQDQLNKLMRQANKLNELLREKSKD